MSLKNKMCKHFDRRQLADGGNDGIAWKMSVIAREGGIERDGGGKGAVVMTLEVPYAFQQFRLDDGIRHEESIGKGKRESVVRLEVLIYDGVEGVFLWLPSVIGRLPATSRKRAVF